MVPCLSLTYRVRVQNEGLKKEKGGQSRAGGAARPKAAANGAPGPRATRPAPVTAPRRGLPKRRVWWAAHGSLSALMRRHIITPALCCAPLVWRLALRPVYFEGLTA